MLYIKNASILTMTGKNYEKGDIVADGEKIIYVGENAQNSLGARLDEAEMIDAQGLVALPGFIDAHSHIGITEEKLGREGDDCNETSEPITPTLRAIDAINPFDSAMHNALAAGVTSAMVGPGSANVIGGQFAFIKLDGRDIDAMTLLAPAAMKVAFGENPKMNYGSSNMSPVTRMSIASMLREELFRAREYKRRRDNAQSNNDNSFEPSFTYETYMPVFEGRIPLKAHVHRADDILTAIRIAKEFSLFMTLDHCTEGHLVVNEIVKSGFPAIIGPSLASRNKPEVESLDFKTAGILNEAGILIALTTDHPVSRIQHLPICAALAAHEGLGEYNALKAVTINPARICRMSHKLGSLERGKDADIALFDGNPLDIFTTVRYTIVNGKVAYNNV